MALRCGEPELPSSTGPRLCHADGGAADGDQPERARRDGAHDQAVCRTSERVERLKGARSKSPTRIAPIKTRGWTARSGADEPDRGGETKKRAAGHV